MALSEDFFRSQSASQSLPPRGRWHGTAVTDEGHLPLPMGEVPGRGGEGDTYPLSRLRHQLPQSGSQGGTKETDCHTSVATLVRNDSVSFGLF